MKRLGAGIAIFLCLAASGCAAAPAQPTVAGASAAAWNDGALAELTEWVGQQNTTGFLVIQNGKVIVERNWPLPESAGTFRANFVHGQTHEGALLEDVASQQKSFIAILAGVAADKGLLDVSRPVSAYIGPGWSKAAPGQEGAITVLHLLEMTSGLDEKLGFEAPAGSRWFYNTPAYAKLQGVLEAASGRSLQEITKAWLADPAGMTNTSWRPRPAAMATSSGNPFGLVSTPADIAKMGELVLRGGVSASGKRVISQEQLSLMLSPADLNPAYSRLWWLNSGDWLLSFGSAPKRTEGRLIPAAPADLVAAQGAQDRKLYVVPSLGLVVVRTGRQAPDAAFNQQLWTRIMAALPASGGAGRP